MNQPTTHDIEIGRRILRNWCQDNNIVIDPVVGSDLVQKIAEAIADPAIHGNAPSVGMPIDPPHDVISVAMQEIPEDGCEYEHIEAAYRAMRVALSSTDGK